VRLWDPLTGAPVGDPLAGHVGAVHTVAAVPLADGRTLVASGGNDATVRLWDAATGVPLGEPIAAAEEGQRQAGGPVWSIAGLRLPNGLTRLAVCYGANQTEFMGTRSIQTWDLAEDAPWFAPAPQARQPTAFFEPKTVAAVPTPSGQALLAAFGAFTEPEIRLWDPTFDEAHTYTLGSVFSEPERFAVVPLPDGRLAVAVAERLTTTMWLLPYPELASGDARRIGEPLIGHTGDVKALAAVPMANGRVLLASAAEDGTVRLWDPLAGTGNSPSGEHVDEGTEDRATGEPAAPLVGYDLRALSVTSTAVLATPDATLLATGCRDETAHIWDATTGLAVGVWLETQPSPTAPGASTWFTDSMAVAAVPMPDGRVAVATGSGRVICLWDPVTGTPLTNRWMLCRLVRVPWDRALNINRMLVARVSANAPVTAMTAVTLPDGEIRLIVGGGRSVHLWQVAPDGRLRRVRGARVPHRERVRAVAAASSADGRSYGASAGDDATLLLWDPASGATTGRAAGHTGPVRALTVHIGPDSSAYVVSGGDDGTVRLWEPGTGAALGDPFTAHQGPVRALAMVGLADRPPVLASSGDDGIVRLWHPPDGKEISATPLALRLTSLAAHDGVLYAGSATGLLALDIDRLLDPTS
jgi:WD40 repeat protein